jgi:hypothetical protein
MSLEQGAVALPPGQQGLVSQALAPLEQVVEVEAFGLLAR